MGRLKIEIDWDGKRSDLPSCYDPENNSIFIEPYYQHNSRIWIIPLLIHEFIHYLIEKLPIYNPNREGKFIFRGKICMCVFHVKLDTTYYWFVSHLTKNDYIKYKLGI